MAIKKVQPNSLFVIGSVIIIVVILFAILALLNKNKKSDMTYNSNVGVEQKPQVIVIDSSRENNKLPIYPNKLPRYNSGDYQQVGILTAQETDKEPIVLPLYGRTIQNRSDRWQYYTATDKENMLRLPLYYQGRDCEDDVGCNELYTGDQITIDIYKDRVFTATVYRTEAPRYFADSY